MREELDSTCHSQVHATFTNTELVRNFTTIESLRDAAQLQPFLHWIRKQKCDRGFKTATPRRERVRIRRRPR